MGPWSTICLSLVRIGSNWHHVYRYKKILLPFYKNAFLGKYFVFVAWILFHHQYEISLDGLEFSFTVINWDLRVRSYCLLSLIEYYVYAYSIRTYIIGSKNRDIGKNVIFLLRKYVGQLKRSANNIFNRFSSERTYYCVFYYIFTCLMLQDYNKSYEKE